MTDEPTSLEWSELPPRLPRARPISVLLVDDDVDFLDTMAQALALEGMIVATARTAGEALMKAVRRPPDVILLDILLGSTDGLDVLEALRAEPETRRIPILACTALGERDSAKLLPTLGFDGLIAKPLNPSALAKTLRARVGPRTE